jgi:bisphosphoglycerate-independent phosphoglycerate mutase (AlkP superfamily)
MLSVCKRQNKKSTSWDWSDGGVHSHTSHLRGLIDATQAYGLEKYLCTLLQTDAM